MVGGRADEAPSHCFPNTATTQWFSAAVVAHGSGAGELLEGPLFFSCTTSSEDPHVLDLWQKGEWRNASTRATVTWRCPIINSGLVLRR